MRDWNQDGKDDYWDDIFYLDQIERDDHSLDNLDTFDFDDDIDVEF